MTTDWNATDVALGFLAVALFPFVALLSVVGFAWSAWFWRDVGGER